MTSPRGIRPTLADVSRAAGVTKSVASRVINNRDSISVRPQTRERILAAARELGYRPHALARALAVAQTNMIAMLVPDLANPAYDRILQGALAAARAHDLVLMILEASEDGSYPGAVSLIEDGRAQGALIGSHTPELAEFLAGTGLPHVYVNREVPASGRNVVIDMAGASSIAVEYLVGLGHRRLAHLAGPETITSSMARTRGFEAVTAELDLPTPLVVHGPFNEQGGAAAMQQILEQPDRPSAVYVGTYTQALGALSVCHRFGIEIPADMSILSADDPPGAEFTIPPLTTLQLPFRELGARAVDSLADQFAGAEPTDVVLPVPDGVTERRSTAPPTEAA